MPNPNDFSVLADGSEQDLYNEIANRVVQAFVNVDAMLLGDTTTIKQYKILTSGGSLVLVKSTTLLGADGGLPGGAKVFSTDPLSAPYGARITLTQTTGSYVTYPGSVDEV